MCSRGRAGFLERMTACGQCLAKAGDHPSRAKAHLVTLRATLAISALEGRMTQPDATVVCVAANW